MAGVWGIWTAKTTLPDRQPERRTRQRSPRQRRSNRAGLPSDPRSQIAACAQDIDRTTTGHHGSSNAQRVAAWESIQNLERGEPMNRLLQGDVGSGKTVVAGLVSYIAARAGFQTAFMAPTELLATQHATTLIGLLEPFGMRDG